MTAHVVILFNTIRYLEKQYELFSRFMQGQFIIIDNSTDTEVAYNAYNFCRGKNIRYIKTDFVEGDYSKSHALACNRAYYILHKEYEILGFYDHDLFPVKEIDINKLMENKVLAGVPQIREEVTYMWPGLTILNNKLIDQRAVDFSPSPGIDTGGEISKIFRQLPENAYHLFAERPNDTHSKIYLDIQEPEPCFIHLINGSNWKNEENFNERIEQVFNILP